MLDIEQSCEIDDLQQEIMRITGRPHDEVEMALFDAYVYPENNKTLIMDDFECDDIPWLQDVIRGIMKQNNLRKVYVTWPI